MSAVFASFCIHCTASEAHTKNCIQLDFLQNLYVLGLIENLGSPGSTKLSCFSIKIKHSLIGVITLTSYQYHLWVSPNVSKPRNMPLKNAKSGSNILNPSTCCVNSPHFHPNIPKFLALLGKSRRKTTNCQFKLQLPTFPTSQLQGCPGPIFLPPNGLDSKRSWHRCQVLHSGSEVVPASKPWQTEDDTYKYL